MELCIVGSYLNIIKAEYDKLIGNITLKVGKLKAFTLKSEAIKVSSVITLIQYGI
jgi:hypothetical protein